MLNNTLIYSREMLKINDHNKQSELLFIQSEVTPDGAYQLN